MVKESGKREHGGKLAAAARQFGIPVSDWVDLSTGLNPCPYPVCVTWDSEIWSRLPDDNLVEKTLTAAKAYYGPPSIDNIAMAPGTQALIQWLPRLRKESKVSIISPTYNEHAAAWAQAGHDVIDAAGLTDSVCESDVIVVVNPNNPDGKVWGKDELLSAAGRVASRGGWLVVDEAFADVLDGQSLSSLCDQPGVVVLRSFGKFFGLAGVRLGFALTNNHLAKCLNEALGPWAVSGPTLEIGRLALQDDDWVQQAKNDLKLKMTRLRTLLGSSGFSIIGGTDLFVLAQWDKAQVVFDHLARAGILVRIFEQYPDRIRFGLPGADEDWQRLEKALADL